MTRTPSGEATEVSCLSQHFPGRTYDEVVCLDGLCDGTGAVTATAAPPTEALPLPPTTVAAVVPVQRRRVTGKRTPPSPALRGTEPVGRLLWLDELVRQVAEKALPASSVYLGHVLTMGHFLFDTGEGTRHQSHGYLAHRAGVSDSSVKRFLGECRSRGLLEPMEGRGVSLRGDSGVSDETPLYRLTVPVRGEGVIPDPREPS